MSDYQSKEAQYLETLIERHGLKDIKHPLISVLIQQLSKLIRLIDMEERNQVKVRAILDDIATTWLAEEEP